MKAAHAVAETVFGTGSTSNVSVSLESETWKSLWGYIFMCNSSTKIECYRYRVFGLPSGKKEVVEQIKPGAKLFLYDFESKLLYGVYEATSVGKMNLEPAAFKGKFPAQVKFKIYKECLPMPETTLKCVIRENYTGSKFKQELSWEQVYKLRSSFHPLYAPSQPASQNLPSSSLPYTMVPLARENQFRHAGGTLHSPEFSYVPRPTMHHTLVPAFAEHQPVSTATTTALHHDYHTPASNYAVHGYTPSLVQPQSQAQPQTQTQLYVQPQAHSHPQSLVQPQPQTQLYVQPQAHLHSQPQAQLHPQPQPYVPVSYDTYHQQAFQTEMSYGTYHQQTFQTETQSQDNGAGHGYHLEGIVYTSSAPQPQAPLAEILSHPSHVANPH